ncbi:hypothetical protein AA0113_g4821 [Alternaria arborescens]|uniref:Uncharacterized protein n=1 Tax=Alternaria arborescens TaxID=156630 RepID=A0A4Q4SAD5_9PLEO|nr:hypothetical protein AA0111_g3868 [Alternaria arborescens]RYO33588.1 hypothetical protein AA0111_g3868 [Alternaria arborescens]RYO67217.1 hypothetical protein AA0113_g4821 [Alternaria arborescens]
MQLAEMLSDLVSLRACDPAAALALVSARSTDLNSISSHDNTAKPNTATDDEQDPDLKRAKDLLKLHYEVKEAHKRGELGRGLEEARSLVKKAVGG